MTVGGDRLKILAERNTSDMKFNNKKILLLFFDNKNHVIFK